VADGSSGAGQRRYELPNHYGALDAVPLDEGSDPGGRAARRVRTTAVAPERVEAHDRDVPTRTQRRAASKALTRRRVLKMGLVAGALGATSVAALGAFELAENTQSSGARKLGARVRQEPLTTGPPPPTTVPPVHDVFASWVQEENARPGTSDWNIPVLGDQHAVEGYFDTVSATLGDEVRLYVSTTATTYHVEAYRMGWYQGLGARLIWSSAELPGRRQDPPTVDPKTNMVDTQWSDPLPVGISTDFVPGCYLFKLVSSDGTARFVPLTIRDDANRSAYLVMNAVTTWQAYNQWGGYSLYWGATSQGQSFASRSRVVSFDRPYEVNGAPQFLAVELPLIHLVERLGLDLSYTTNVDVHRTPESVLAHKALVSLGHDEYYSRAMRTGLETARNQGINLAFLGANAIFRQIRYQDSPLGANRREVCYKSAAEDPDSRANPELTTVNWRDAPVNEPENQLIGSQYESNPVEADMVITNPDSWVFADTGLQPGATLPLLVGGEYDRYHSGAGVPDNVEILAHSPLVCRGRASYADMTYYSAPSGAGVFDVGTQAWVNVLGPPNEVPAAVGITTNVLTAFGRGPAGQTHPSTPTAIGSGPSQRGTTGSE
jgi:hypothetical protein